jgi:hypothetical protein
MLEFQKKYELKYKKWKSKINFLNLLSEQKKWIAVISQISETIWLGDRSTRFYECRYIEHKVTCHNGTQGINKKWYDGQQLNVLAYKE